MLEQTVPATGRVMAQFKLKTTLHCNCISQDTMAKSNSTPKSKVQKSPHKSAMSSKSNAKSNIVTPNTVTEQSSNLVTKQASPEAGLRKKKSKKKSAKSARQPFVLDHKTETLLRTNHYEIKERLGLGAFSEVFRAYNSKKELDCAVKIIDLNMMNEKYHTKFLPRELQNLSEVRHDSIIRIYDIFRISNRILIFMEVANKGDLAKYLKSLHAPMEERSAAKWFYQICQALFYLHNELGIAHRDIKIDNILIASDNSVKLTDFGFSLHVIENEENEPQLSTTFCGTRPYLAPQIVAKKPYNPFKADVWALGVVLFAMLCNRYPFHYKDRQSMLHEQRNREYITGRFISSLSTSSKNLMLAMFEFEEEKRIDVAKILEHEWLVNNYDHEVVVELEE